MNILKKIAVLAVVLALSACGGGSGSSTSTTTTNTTGTTYDVAIAANSTSIPAVYGGNAALGTVEITTSHNLELSSIQVLIESNGPLTLVDLNATMDGQVIGTIARPTIGANILQFKKGLGMNTSQTRKITVSVSMAAGGTASTMKASIPANGIVFVDTAGTVAKINHNALSLASIPLHRNGSLAFQTTNFTNVSVRSGEIGSKIHELSVTASDAESIRVTRMDYAVVAPTTAVNPGWNLFHFRLYANGVPVANGSSTLVNNRVDFSGIGLTIEKGTKVIFTLTSDVYPVSPGYEKGTTISLTANYAEYIGMDSSMHITMTDFSGLKPVTIQLQ